VRLARQLLWFDSSAGLLAGVAMLTLSGWLSALYALPRGLLLGMGVANVAYGTFSGLLARRAHRPRSLIVLLVCANAAWAALCGVAAASLAGRASALGLAHLIAEGIFVGGLAALEWRQREQLLHAA
jgi:hypothetical protein